MPRSTASTSGVMTEKPLAWGLSFGIIVLILPWFSVMLFGFFDCEYCGCFDDCLCAGGEGELDGALLECV